MFVNIHLKPFFITSSTTFQFHELSNNYVIRLPFTVLVAYAQNNINQIISQVQTDYITDLVRF